MALAFARKGYLPYQIVGDQKRTVTDVTFDSSYPTGGEAVTADNLGLRVIDTASCNDVTATGGLVNVANATFDLTNSKILLFDETPAEVANAADVATAVVRVEAWGK